MVMPNEGQYFAPEIDEYLWPLTGDMSQVDWTALTEELRIRARLGEIMGHVRERHVQPRIRRLGQRTSQAAIDALTARVIAGPADGPPWLQTLHEPVPRALREEWSDLARRLHELHSGGQHSGAAHR